MTPHAEMLLAQLKDISRDFWDDSPLGERLTAVHIGLTALLEVQSETAAASKPQGLVCAHCGDDDFIPPDPLYS